MLGASSILPRSQERSSPKSCPSLSCSLSLPSPPSSNHSEYSFPPHTLLCGKENLQTQFSSPWLSRMFQCSVALSPMYFSATDTLGKCLPLLSLWYQSKHGNRRSLQCSGGESQTESRMLSLPVLLWKCQLVSFHNHLRRCFSVKCSKRHSFLSIAGMRGVFFFFKCLQ